MTTPATTIAAANVRAEMARRGISQETLARQVGLSQSRLSKRLRGVIAFDINELTAIADVLQVPLDSLLDGVGSAA